MDVETDSALLARWRGGDRAAGLCLLRREVQPIRRYFSRRVPCAADADDLAQRTLLASIDALPRFREDAELSRFVRAIASKLLLRYLRDGERARMRLHAGLQPDAVQARQVSAFSWICGEDAQRRLRSALRELSNDSANLLRLRYWEDRRTEEIAGLLGLKPGAVRTRLHRARLEVRRVLAAMMGPEGAPAEADASAPSKRGARCSSVSTSRR
jgi:RNA polymerase sigma-70 factor (ECF subfamily)